MKMYIPQLGDIITLSKEWKFILYSDYRNVEFHDKVTNTKSNSRWSQYSPDNVILPVGTQLSIDRIYIRKGSEDYNSVTFRIKSCPFKSFEKSRFWAKLKDVNEIEFE